MLFLSVWTLVELRAARKILSPALKSNEIKNIVGGVPQSIGLNEPQFLATKEAQARDISMLTREGITAIAWWMRSK